jgi:hypothetical protein
VHNSLRPKSSPTFSLRSPLPKEQWSRHSQSTVSGCRGRARSMKFTGILHRTPLRNHTVDKCVCSKRPLCAGLWLTTSSPFWDAGVGFGEGIEETSGPP